MSSISDSSHLEGSSRRPTGRTSWLVFLKNRFVISIRYLMFSSQLMLRIFCKVPSTQRLCQAPLLTLWRIAGGETTATTLATVTWYLAHDQAILSKVQHEVRNTFQSYAAIDAQSTSRLSYIHAVCLEALRVYPPLPLGLPRLVPEPGAVIDGHVVPGGVRIYALEFWGIGNWETPNRRPWAPILSPQVCPRPTSRTRGFLTRSAGQLGILGISWMPANLSRWSREHVLGERESLLYIHPGFIVMLTTCHINKVWHGWSYIQLWQKYIICMTWRW